MAKAGVRCQSCKRRVYIEDWDGDCPDCEPRHRAQREVTREE